VSMLGLNQQRAARFSGKKTPRRQRASAFLFSATPKNTQLVREVVEAEAPSYARHDLVVAHHVVRVRERLFLFLGFCFQRESERQRGGASEDGDGERASARALTTKKGASPSSRRPRPS
jgi:hypothetical protein